MLGDIEGETLSLTLGEIDSDNEGETEGLGEVDGDIEALTEGEMLSEILGETEGLIDGD